MCRFDLLIVPRDARPEAVLKAEGKHPSAWKLPTLRPKLPEGSQILITGRTCDCASVLGRWQPPEALPDRTAHLEQEAQRLRRKGWGEHKVARWLEEKRNEKPEHAPPQDGVPEEAWRWLRILGRLVEEMPWVGLYLHQFTGSDRDEGFPVRDRRELRARRLDAEALLHLEEDVLYLIRP